MPNLQPVITSADGERTFACSPVAVVVFVVNDREQLLVGYHNKRKRWEVISGLLEAEESVLSGATRELREEMGSKIRVRPLGVLHASTFRYDDNAQYMISISYLMAYQGGHILPGDDMSGMGYRWLALDEITSGRVSVGIPRDQWLIHRAVEMHRLWSEQAEVLLQSE